ncbi:MAG: TetR/AcrR family transcriptional regulator [Acidimicrobiales bacterium]
MPRRTPPDRLRDIARAACTVFIEKGFRRALMTDVGRELGLSHAMLYRFVVSKEALFHLALLYAVDPGAVATLPVPVPTPTTAEMLAPLTAWTAAGLGFPVLRRALAVDRCSDIRREFTGVLDELYTGVEDHHVLLALIESSAVDLPELHALYFDRTRGGVVGELTRYVEMRIRSGQLRDVPDARMATLFIVETVAFFAWHRRDGPDHDPARTQDADADADARRSAIYLVVAALVPDDRPDPLALGRTNPSYPVDLPDPSIAVDPADPVDPVDRAPR